MAQAPSPAPNLSLIISTLSRLNILTDYFELFLPVYSSIGYELNQENYLSKVRFRISFDPKTLSGLISRRWF